LATAAGATLAGAASSACGATALFPFTLFSGRFASFATGLGRALRVIGEAALVLHPLVSAAATALTTLVTTLVAAFAFVLLSHCVDVFSQMTKRDDRSCNHKGA
jgi:hypothetical protein